MAYRQESGFLEGGCDLNWLSFDENEVVDLVAQLRSDTQQRRSSLDTMSVVTIPWRSAGDDLTSDSSLGGSPLMRLLRRVGAAHLRLAGMVDLELSQCWRTLLLKVDVQKRSSSSGYAPSRPCRPLSHAKDHGSGRATRMREP